MSYQEQPNARNSSLQFIAQEVLISMVPLGVVPGKCGSDLGVAGFESSHKTFAEALSTSW